MVKKTQQILRHAGWLYFVPIACQVPKAALGLSFNAGLVSKLPFRWLAARVRRLGASRFPVLESPRFVYFIGTGSQFSPPSSIVPFEKDSTRFKIIPQSAPIKIILLAWELIHQRGLDFWTVLDKIRFWKLHGITSWNGWRLQDLSLTGKKRFVCSLWKLEVLEARSVWKIIRHYSWKVPRLPCT